VVGAHRHRWRAARSSESRSDGATTRSRERGGCNRRRLTARLPRPQETWALDVAIRFHDDGALFAASVLSYRAAWLRHPELRINAREVRFHVEASGRSVRLAKADFGEYRAERRGSHGQASRPRRAGSAEPRSRRRHSAR
jgi:hypothetical protein